MPKQPTKEARSKKNSDSRRIGTLAVPPRVRGLNANEIEEIKHAVRKGFLTGEWVWYRD